MKCYEATANPGYFQDERENLGGRGQTILFPPSKFCKQFNLELWDALSGFKITWSVAMFDCLSDCLRCPDITAFISIPCTTSTPFLNYAHTWAKEQEFPERKMKKQPFIKYENTKNAFTMRNVRRQAQAIEICSRRREYVCFCLG